MNYDKVAELLNQDDQSIKNWTLDYLVGIVNEDNRYLYDEKFMELLSIKFWEEFGKAKFYEDVIFEEKTKHLCSVIQKYRIFE